MQIGVFTALWGNLSFEEALDKAVSFGITAVEIGAGGYPGQPHCPVDELLDSETKRDEWMGKIKERGLTLSALSVHNNPVHPDQKIAAEADTVIKKAIKLAAQLEVPTVNGFSGLPAGSTKDTMPNWVTCAWPPHFLDILDYQWNEVTIPYWKTIHPLLEENNITFCNDYKHYGDIPKRSWTFRSIGYGHDLKAWKDIISALRMVGYDYVISIEHEDAMMSPDEGLGKAVGILKDSLIFEEAGDMFWA